MRLQGCTPCSQTTLLLGNAARQELPGKRLAIVRALPGAAAAVGQARGRKPGRAGGGRERGRQHELDAGGRRRAAHHAHRRVQLRLQARHQRAALLQLHTIEPQINALQPDAPACRFDLCHGRPQT